MSSFFCYNCTTKLGFVSPAVTANLTGTLYQLTKYHKHTTSPTGNMLPISVFDDPSIENYAGHIATAIASGSVEVDSWGRKSFVYAAQERVGTTYSSGYRRADSAVRVVCPDDPQKIHPYPTASEQIVNGHCVKCGGPLTR